MDLSGASISDTWRALKEMDYKNKSNIEATIFGVYTAALLIQNILALKTIDVFIFTMTTGVLVSPLVFIAQDVQSEVFGYKRARNMILLAYAMNFIFTILMCLAIVIKPSGAYQNQEAFSTIFSTTFRITLASFCAYCVGSLTNARIMTTKREDRSLFNRAISSTVVGQLLDNAIFSFGAFLFVLPFNAIVSMVIGATIWETLYEVAIFPITKRVIAKVKQAKDAEEHAESETLASAK